MRFLSLIIITSLLFISGCCRDCADSFIIQGYVLSNTDGSPCSDFDIKLEHKIIESGSFNDFYQDAAETTTDNNGFYSMEFDRETALAYRISIEEDGWFPVLEEISPELFTPNIPLDYDLITTPRADIDILVYNAPPFSSEDKIIVRLLKEFEEYSTCDTEWRAYLGANVDSTWSCIIPGDIYMPYISIDQTDLENEIEIVDSVFCPAFETTEINIIY